MSLNEFEFGKELGKGAFSSVHVVKRKVDGKTYAIKRIKISQLSNKERENALNEIRLLASLSHINIIGYKEAFFDEISRTMNIVMELADDGDILSKIKSYTQSKMYLKENIIWSILIQVLQGMKYLHDNNIMHRDMKCANVFLMKSGVVKIGDLNVSKIANMGMASTQTGTPYYASPEVWKDKPYDYKSDIWSIGCVIYEMCTLKTPFKGPSLQAVFTNVQRGIYDPIPYIYSKELSKVISYMLQVNPISRLTCDQLLKTDLITDKMKSIQHIEKINGSQMDSKVELIKTIKIPKNLREINRALPSKQYDTEEDCIESYYNNRKKNKFTSNSNNNKGIAKKAINSSSNNIKSNNNRVVNQDMEIIKAINQKVLSQDQVSNQYNKCTRKGERGNNNYILVYSKPLITNNKNNKLAESNQNQSNKIKNKKTESSPILNKAINRNLSPCFNYKAPITPNRLSKNVSPFLQNKSALRNLNRPITSIPNKSKLVTPNRNKNINTTPNKPLSSITRQQKKKTVRETSKPIVQIK